MPSREELNKSLNEAAGKGDVQTVLRRLDDGADINCLHCTDGCRMTPLMWAADKGFFSVAQILLERGANKEMTNSAGYTAAQIAHTNGHPEIESLINAHGQSGNPEKVIFYSEIGDRTREDIYDFTHHGRITLIRTGKFGAVESSHITGFSAIEDQSENSMLRQAFNEHLRRGGKTDEAALFPKSMIKPGLSPKR